MGFWGGNILSRKISKYKGPEAGQCLACLSGSVHVLFKEEQGSRCDWNRVIGSENGNRGGQRGSRGLRMGDLIGLGKDFGFDSE